MFKGEDIRKKRKSLQLTVDELASIIGVKSDNLYKWEKGTRPNNAEDYLKVENWLTGKLESVPHETPRQEDRPRVVNEGESKYGESFSDRILRLMESNNRILEQQARTNTNLSETNRRLSDELINSRTESKNPLDDPSKWADLRELLADLASGKRFRSKQEAVAAIRSIFGAVEPKV